MTRIKAALCCISRYNFVLKREENNLPYYPSSIQYLESSLEGCSGAADAMDNLNDQCLHFCKNLLNLLDPMDQHRYSTSGHKLYNAIFLKDQQCRRPSPIRQLTSFHETAATMFQPGSQVSEEFHQ